MATSGMTVNDVIGKSSSFDEAVKLYQAHNGSAPEGDDMTAIFKKFYKGSGNDDDLNKGPNAF